MTQEEANAYWAQREWKKWVVLFKGPKRLRLERIGNSAALRPLSPYREMFVRARSRNGAISVARANLFTKERMELIGARLARPYDLGCVQTPEARA